MQRIGFIGASGMMGHGMAKNLLAKGHPLALTVHRNADRVADLLAAGAQQLPNAKALAEASDVVGVDGGRGDGDVAVFAGTGHLDRDHAATRRTGDDLGRLRLLGGLHLLLHGLRLLEDGAEIEAARAAEGSGEISQIGLFVHVGIGHRIAPTRGR